MSPETYNGDDDLPSLEVFNDTEVPLNVDKGPDRLALLKEFVFTTDPIEDSIHFLKITARENYWDVSADRDKAFRVVFLRKLIRETLQFQEEWIDPHSDLNQRLEITTGLEKTPESPEVGSRYYDDLLVPKEEVRVLRQILTEFEAICSDSQGLDQLSDRLEVKLSEIREYSFRTSEYALTVSRNIFTLVGSVSGDHKSAAQILSESVDQAVRLLVESCELGSRGVDFLLDALKTSRRQVKPDQMYEYEERMLEVYDRIETTSIHTRAICEKAKADIDATVKLISEMVLDN